VNATIDAAATHPRTTALALAAAVLAAASFIAMDGTVKWLGERYGTAQVTFLRFAFGTLYAVPLWLWWRTPLPTRSQWRWHLLRSALLLVALLTWFHALKTLPLVQAVGIGYTAPLFISLLAIWPTRASWWWPVTRRNKAGSGRSCWCRTWCRRSCWRCRCGGCGSRCGSPTSRCCC
jgi:drug/metabolite transporter (DMT)-like permease